MSEDKHAGRPFIDVPLFYMIFKPCAVAIAPVWRGFCMIRWAVARPLNTSLLPKFIPKIVPHITIGELLFAIAWGVIFFVSYQVSFNQKETEESGSVASLPLVVVFLTANKSNSLISFIFGVPFERMVKWHALWAVLSVITAAFHYYVAYAFGEGDDRRFLGDGGGGDSIHSLVGTNPDFIKFSFDGDENTTGTIFFIALLLLTVPNFISMLRRWFFEVFYYFHVILVIVLSVFAMMHGAAAVAGVFIWWVIDMLIRYLLMAGLLYPHEATIRSLPADVIEISFPKPANFDYNPGQFIQIAIPKLSISQFHPFSLSSSPHQDTVTIHIRVLGNWTKQLSELAKKQNSVNILMEGPYGMLGVDIDNEERYKMIMLISGGIGITPMQSIYNSLVHEKERGRELKHVHFVWSVRQFDMIDALRDSEGGPMLPEEVTRLSFQPDLVSQTSISSKTSAVQVVTDGDNDEKNPILQTDFYLTGKKQSDEDEKQLPSHVHLGRPNINQIFENMKKRAIRNGESHVVVCVCGPAPLVDACKEASRQFSDTCQGVQFEFHEETFDL